ALEKRMRASDDSINAFEKRFDAFVKHTFYKFDALEKRIDALEKCAASEVLEKRLDGLETYMHTGFAALKTRLENTSKNFREVREDLGDRFNTMADFIRLTDQGYFKMSDRMLNLKHRLSKLENPT